MGKVLLEEQNLIDIANSIRNKTGSSETMKPSEMATNIDNISANLGTKTITQNGIYNASDDNLDGYSQVNVETNGADLSEYFAESITKGTSSIPGWLKNVIKLPAFKNIEGTSCAYMFSKFNGTEIDFSNFNTTNVTNMSYMFDDCVNLKTIDVSNFDTSKVTTMTYMFDNCDSVIELDISNWDTSSLSDMSYMFNSSYRLQRVNLKGINTQKVTTVNSLFYGCQQLQSIDLSDFDTSSLTTARRILRGCGNLQTANVTNFLKGTNVDVYEYFSQCYKLGEIIGINTWDTSLITSMDSLFYDCWVLPSLDLSNWDTSNVTNMNGMFYNCKVLAHLDIRNFDFTNVTSYSSMFSGVPNNCEIIVKDETAKQWVLAKKSTFTNVKTIAEYESEV